MINDLHIRALNANRQGYDRWAVTYDSDANSTVAADEVALPPLYAHLTGLHVLEIGCGTGRHTARLLAAGNRVTGIDVSSGMLDQARAKIDSAELALLHGDVLTCAELVPGGYDAALTALVIEHIADLSAFFARVATLLRPGAPFIISEIHPDRMATGSGARFIDRDTGDEVRLSGFPHSIAAVENAALAAGFHIQAGIDVAASEALITQHPDWEKYRGRSMLRLWHLRRSDR